MTTNAVQDVWSSFDRLMAKRKRKRAKRTIHKFVRRERKKKAPDAYGRTY